MYPSLKPLSPWILSTSGIPMGSSMLSPAPDSHGLHFLSHTFFRLHAQTILVCFYSAFPLLISSLPISTPLHFFFFWVYKSTSASSSPTSLSGATVIYSLPSTLIHTAALASTLLQGFSLQVNWHSHKPDYSLPSISSMPYAWFFLLSSSILHIYLHSKPQVLAYAQMSCFHLSKPLSAHSLLSSVKAILLVNTMQQGHLSECSWWGYPGQTQTRTS